MAPNQENIEAKLCAYIDGEMSALERTEIEQHLASNPHHRKLLRDLTQTRTLLRALPRVKAPIDLVDAFQSQLERSVLFGGNERDGSSETSLRINRWPQIFSAAAIVLLSVGLVGIVYKVLPSSTPHREVAVNLGPGNSPSLLTTEDASVGDGISADRVSTEPETHSKMGAQSRALHGPTAPAAPAPEISDAARRKEIATKATGGGSGGRAMDLNGTAVSQGPLESSLNASKTSNSQTALTQVDKSLVSQQAEAPVLMVVNSRNPSQANEDVAGYLRDNRITFAPMPDLQPIAQGPAAGILETAVTNTVAVAPGLPLVETAQKPAIPAPVSPAGGAKDIDQRPLAAAPIGQNKSGWYEKDGRMFYGPLADAPQPAQPAAVGEKFAGGEIGVTSARPEQRAAASPDALQLVNTAAGTTGAASAAPVGTPSSDPGGNRAVPVTQPISGAQLANSGNAYLGSGTFNGFNNGSNYTYRAMMSRRQVEDLNQRLQQREGQLSQIRSDAMQNRPEAYIVAENLRVNPLAKAKVAEPTGDNTKRVGGDNLAPIAVAVTPPAPIVIAQSQTLTDAKADRDASASRVIKSNVTDTERAADQPLPGPVTTDEVAKRSSAVPTPVPVTAPTVATMPAGSESSPAKGAPMPAYAAAGKLESQQNLQPRQVEQEQDERPHEVIIVVNSQQVAPTTAPTSQPAPPPATAPSPAPRPVQQ